MNRETRVQIEYVNTSALRLEALIEAHKCDCGEEREAIFEREGVEPLGYITCYASDFKNHAHEAYGEVVTTDGDVVRQVIDLDTHEVYYAHGE